MLWTRPPQGETPGLCPLVRRQRTLAPPPASDDCSRHRTSKWYREAAGERPGKTIKEGQEVEKPAPRPRHYTEWDNKPEGSPTVHDWTHGSFRRSTGLGWVITEDENDGGNTIAQGRETLGTRQTAFDAEVMDGAHSLSTPTLQALLRGRDGPGELHAIQIHRGFSKLRTRTADIISVKRHGGAASNEQADKLAGEAAKRLGSYIVMWLAHLQLKIFEKFRKA